MEDKENKKLKINKETSLSNKKENSNFIIENTSLNQSINELKANNNIQKNINKKNFRKKMQANIRNKDNFNLPNTNTENNINLKDSIKKDNINFKDTVKKDNINFKDTIRKDKNSTENSYTSKDNFSEKKSNSSKENSKSKLKFKNEETLKQDKKTNTKEFSKSEFEADLKNLKLEAKKIGLEFDKTSVEKKIRKNYKLQFGERQEVIDENNNFKIVNKFKPRIKSTGFQYKDGIIRKTRYALNDLSRRTIHNEIYKSEKDNTTVQAVHRTEQFIERNTINFVRNTNNRRISKYNKLDMKISKLESKKVLNSFKEDLKNDKESYKKAVKLQKQKNTYKKRMYRKIQIEKMKRKLKISDFSNLISLTNKGTMLFNILSFKALLVGIGAFFVVGFFSFLVMLVSYASSSENIYEIQKAELFYRELEANTEYNTGVKLDHDPIELASFLTVLFGAFEFNEDMETFLKEILFSKQYSEDKSLKQIIRETLTEEEYEYYLYLYENKCEFIRYGSPFSFAYETYISSYVGYRINPTSTETEIQLHKGLDISVDSGTEILTIADGIVIRADYSESYGNIVEILHNDGYISKYAHQKQIKVKTGDIVKQGDVIGYVGTTGDSTGNHLHLELYDELGELMNPIYFIERSFESY